jgi:hypothetical protein
VRSTITRRARLLQGENLPGRRRRLTADISYCSVTELPAYPKVKAVYTIAQ